METQEDLLNLIKSPDELTNISGREPGIYRDNLLQVLGNKMGKVFKDLNTKHYNLDETVKNIDTNVSTIQEDIKNYQQFISDKMAEIETRIKETQESIGTIDDFNTALNS